MKVRGGLRVALIGAAYLLAHWLGLRFVAAPLYVSPVWPASGIALAALLRERPLRWPGYALLFASASVISNLADGGPLLTSIAFGASNALECLGAAWLANRGLLVTFTLARVKDVLRLLGAAAVAPAIAVAISAGGLFLHGGAPFAVSYRTLWTGNTLGILLVTPVVLAWTEPAEGVRPASRLRVAEGLVLAVFFCAASWSAFGPGLQAPDLQPYLLVVLLAWAAMRFGQRGVTSAVLVLSAIAVGALASAKLTERTTLELLSLQTYLGLAIATGLLLAASISEARSSEHAARRDHGLLLEALEHLHLALDAARMGTWQFDIATGAVQWSEEVEPIYGVARGSFGGTYESYLRATHPADRNAVRVAIEGAIAGSNEVIELEHRVVMPDGSIRWIGGKGRIHRDASGKAIRMAGTVLDVTERRLAREHLRASEELLRQFIRHTPAAVAMLDTEMRYLQVADRWLTDYRLQGQDIIGRSHYDVFPDLAERWKEVHRRVLNGAVERCDEDAFTRADGTTQWLQWEVRPWFKSGGTIGGLIMFTQVITERRRADEALRQTQKLEALGTLAGGIAHDFNNILGAIVAYADLAKFDRRADRELQDYLDQILQACARAADLVRQILSFSRQQKQELRPMPLAPVVSQALELLRATLPATLAITRRIDPALREVRLDPTQIHQVIMNLGTNAAHAMNNRGEMSVRVDMLRIDAGAPPPHVDLRPGVYARIEVHDTGHGMNSATLARIFDPFFTTKGPGEGTGLGLAVVHGIVKDHGGVITVWSELGKGSTFTIYLPVATSGAALASEAPVAALEGGQGQRVLFVDDEPFLCRAAKRFLARAGYRAVVHQKPQEALLNFEQTPQDFDLIVTDLMMPGMTGLELMAKLAQIRPNFPMILTSGHIDAATLALAQKLGVKAIVRKPFDYAELTSAIASALEPSRVDGVPA